MRIYSVQTMRRTSNLAGLEVCVGKKKPLLSHKNIQAHLDFAKSHENWTVVHWKQVVFSYETKLNYFCSKVLFMVLGSR